MLEQTEPKPRRIGRPRSISDTEIAQLLDSLNLKPLTPYPGNNTPWPCHCLTCGNETSPRLTHLRSGASRGCRTCSDATHPRRAIRTDVRAAERIWAEANLQPLSPFPGTNQPWPSKCLRCNREVSPRLSHVRDGRSSGCGYCAGTRLDPEAAAQLIRDAGYEPLAPYPGNNKLPWRLRCMTCQRLVPKSYNEVQRGAGCKWCAHCAVDPSEAATVARSRDFEPLEPYPGTGRGWRCRCLLCGEESAPHWSNLRTGSRCQWCSGKLVSTGAVAAFARSRDFEPLEPYVGDRRARWSCLCTRCGNTTRVTYAGLQRGDRSACGCGAYDLSAAGHSMGLYLVSNVSLDAIKVGLGIVKHGSMPRLRAHRRFGWTVVCEWHGLPSLLSAFAAEADVLNAWRDSGLPEAVAPHQMPQAGHTETVPLSRIRLDEEIARCTEAVALHMADETCVSAA